MQIFGFSFEPNQIQKGQWEIGPNRFTRLFFP
jgi:hypothetical protein